MGNTAEKHASGSSVVLLPQSDSRTVCVSLHGLVSLEDYERNFYKPLEKVFSSNEPFGLLIYYDKTYKGWTTDAAHKSFESIIDHGRNARKLAYVNPPESKIFQVKMAGALLSGEIRFFEDGQLDEALKWIKE